MKAAFYESDITPPLFTFMAGEHYPIFAHDVHDKIFSKALVIEQDGETAVIISVDMCEFPEDLYERVTERIEKHTGIAPERVSITSTHAHCGAPVTDCAYIDCFADKPYVDIFYRLVADSAILAYKRLDTAEAFFGSTETENIAHSRCCLWDDGKIKTGRPSTVHTVKPLHEIDTELTCLFFERDGKKLGAVINFPCHQDTVYGDPAVEGLGIEEHAGHSGDMASIISKRLKNEYGEDFVALFLIGPSGDVATGEPLPTDSPRGDGHVLLGTMLADYVKKASLDTHAISGKLKTSTEEITVKKRKYTKEEMWRLAKACVGDSPQDFNIIKLNNLIAYHLCDRTDEKLLRIKVISIGDFAMYVYPGEIFSIYGLNTKRNSPFKYNMVVENSNCFGGYIPTREAFAENSELYEISPAHCCNLAEDTGDVLYEHILSLSKKNK